jgi:phthiocerol/phenolphthiocerol synthesis type-I polyketide synthase C
MDKSDETVIHKLRYWSELQPQAIALRLFSKGVSGVSCTYSEFWREILRHADSIADKVPAGERAVLLFEPGMAFIFHFFGCLLARVVAVPIYPPNIGNEQRGIDLMSRILESCGAKVVFMSPMIEKLKFFKGTWPRNIEYIVLQSSPSIHHLDKDTFNIPSLPCDKDIAFIQYTSGSTGLPKGVIIGHDNFLHQCNLCGLLCQSTAQKSILTSWLPPYHDMGLSACLSNILVLGGEVNLMSPADFLRDPLTWFDVVSATRSTHSVAPNFSFGLVSRSEPVDGICATSSPSPPPRSPFNWPPSLASSPSCEEMCLLSV